MWSGLRFVGLPCGFPAPLPCSDSLLAPWVLLFLPRLGGDDYQNNNSMNKPRLIFASTLAAITILIFYNGLTNIEEGAWLFKGLIPTTDSMAITKNLGIPRNIRKSPVGVTGTKYKPLDVNNYFRFV